MRQGGCQSAVAMKNRLYLLCGMMLVAAVGGLLWWTVRAMPRQGPEPVYDGILLSDYIAGRQLGRAIPPPMSLLRDTNAVPFIIRALKTDSWFGAAWYRKWLWPRLTPSIRRHLPPPYADAHANPIIQSWAAEMLASMGSIAKPAIPALIRVLKKNESAYVRAAAAQALGDLGNGDKSAIAALTEALSNDEMSVRGSASGALEKVDPEAPARMVPSLLQKATNVDSSVRCSAIIALGFIRAEPDRIVPVVINALHDPGTHYFAVRALGLLGPNAKPAVPALMELLNTSSNGTSVAYVADALWQIDPEAAVKAGVKRSAYPNF
jgi:hypothetical protein